MPTIDEIEAWFHSACALPDRAQRMEFLQAQCGADTKLLQRLLSMLEADASAHELLDVQTRIMAADLPHEDSEASDLPTGTVLGPYELIRVIGRGGMGVVYEARQQTPIQRQVAVKVMRTPSATNTSLSHRFDQERQLLSRLQHPHITTILDAGFDDSGRPYFAMELVHGSSITSYCDEQKMTVAQRVRLFERVCTAIHHAHQRGVLHLDIKPGNLLIQTVDDHPAPKIIDFGIAEAMDAINGDGSDIRKEDSHDGNHDSDSAAASRSTPALQADEATRVGTTVVNPRQHSVADGIMGTPLYMSPEHFRLPRQELDARADIYSIGVVLYELVAGTVPMDPAQPGDHQSDMLTAIQSGLVMRPAQRFENYSSPDAERMASDRQTSPTALASLLHGELADVIMKCLAVDPDDRYDSAAAVARDLKAYGEGRPLDAIAPSFRYHASKLLQRNRRLFSLLAAVSVIVLVSAVVSTVLAINNQRLREVADQRAAGLERQTLELQSTNRQLQAALLRATQAEAGLRVVADENRRNAAIERAVNRYSLMMMADAKQSGFSIDSTASLPQLGGSAGAGRRGDQGEPADPGEQADSLIGNRPAGVTQQNFSVGGIPISISGPGATVSTNVKPLTVGGKLEGGLSVQDYLRAVVGLFGGRLSQLQAMVLSELERELGPQHPLVMQFRQRCQATTTEGE